MNSPRLKVLYREKILQELKKKLGVSNDLGVPRLSKIVISMGLGKHARDSGFFDEALDSLGLIAGQKPVIRKAKKSIAEFNTRAGMPSGIMVTLRRDRMYYFLDRFVNIALPRTRDFRGFSKSSFDGNGNFNIGVQEQSIFPEVDYLKAISRYGMNISIATTANDDDSALELLKMFDFPFSK